jgi:hypothetical protein
MNLDDYKDMINGLSLALMGKPAQFTEDEWEKRFRKFVESAEAKKKENKSDPQE